MNENYEENVREVTERITDALSSYGITVSYENMSTDDLIDLAYQYDYRCVNEMLNDIRHTLIQYGDEYVLVAHSDKTYPWAVWGIVAQTLLDIMNCIVHSDDIKGILPKAINSITEMIELYQKRD